MSKLRRWLGIERPAPRPPMRYFAITDDRGEVVRRMSDFDDREARRSAKRQHGHVLEFDSWDDIPPLRARVSTRGYR